jgi:hypothetical protein
VWAAVERIVKYITYFKAKLVQDKVPWHLGQETTDRTSPRLQYQEYLVTIIVSHAPQSVDLELQLEDS